MFYELAKQFEETNGIFVGDAKKNKKIDPQDEFKLMSTKRCLFITMNTTDYHGVLRSLLETDEVLEKHLNSDSIESMETQKQKGDNTHSFNCSHFEKCVLLKCDHCNLCVWRFKFNESNQFTPTRDSINMKWYENIIETFSQPGYEIEVFIQSHASNHA